MPYFTIVKFFDPKIVRKTSKIAKFSRKSPKIDQFHENYRTTLIFTLQNTPKSPSQNITFVYIFDPISQLVVTRQVFTRRMFSQKEEAQRKPGLLNFASGFLHFLESYLKRRTDIGIRTHGSCHSEVVLIHQKLPPDNIAERISVHPIEISYLLFRF